jgi:hypothetical protein
MRSKVLLCVALTLTVLLSAQSKPRPSQTTYGECSPNMADNSGTVNISCSHLDPAVATQLIELVKQISALNKKAATEKNQQLILKTLQDMNSSLKATMSGVQVNAPIVQTSAGDCSPNIVGVGNTNNCTPPVRITASFNVPQPGPSADGHPRLSFKFYTDRTWIEGRFVITCDRNCHLMPGACALPGANPGTEWGMMTGASNMPAIDFHREFPAFTYCNLTVESDDTNPVQITGINTLILTDQKPR